MRLKKAAALVGSAVLVLIVFMIYSTRDLNQLPHHQSSIVEDFQDNKWLHFEKRIKQLENDLNQHHNAVHEMKIAMRNILKPSSSTPTFKNVSLAPKITITDMVYDSSCSFVVNSLPHPNIQMLEMYKNLKFENVDGGVWKQGWKYDVDEKDWNRFNKLKVFVVPHSHNDPGWIKTVEEYYLSQTKHILNNMIEKLPLDPRRKFIWAEMSYFSMWWEDLNDDEREIVKRLIRNKQLEIVTGGWVMNDEANSHWLSIVHQLTEGHQWLKKHLNYTPKSSWSIDPFGMSLTQPYLLKKMNLHNLLIQRVHYSVKKELAGKKQLEFRWRQLWDSGNSDLFTHMMPFYSYDIPHTCGPDPKVCCQFDFKRLPGHGLQCPWKIPPQEINDNNIVQKVDLLLDQYRKKSKLFKTNTLLVPLGDDFRYDHPTEWDVQFNNYQKLFDHMNGNLNLNVHAQFGTLSDYFNELHKHHKPTDFPSLSGDFFTYADRDDHYWSGYYTSRPFYKRMDRILLSYVRTAEIILMLAHFNGQEKTHWITDPEIGLQHYLSEAKKQLALFQHHDGITGTAKDHVVVDYGKKMWTAIQNCQKVIQHSTHILLNGQNAGDSNPEMSFYYLDDIRQDFNAIGEHQQITIGPELRTKRIVLFNSLAFTRIEVVTFVVSTPFVEVVDLKGKRISCQISPVFEYGSTMSLNKFQLSFIANIPAFGLVGYTVNALWQHETPRETKYASIKIYNQYGEIQPPNGFKNVQVSPSSSEFTLQNTRTTASFNKFGLLKALKVGLNTIPVHLDFARYGVRQTVERSGAYLFLPDGDARLVSIDNTIVNVIEGPIMSSVTVQLPHIRHTVSLFNTVGADGVGLEIENLVDISKTSNFELAMRFSTNIESTDEFFTDVNSYQVVRRKRFKKLPLQANFYPIPSMGYIEDGKNRLTLLTGSPLGFSSLKPGQIEVVLDRRLNQDDNLGLGQGVLDNIPVKHVFRLVLERRTHNCQRVAEGHPAGFPSVSAHVTLQTLLNPIVRLLRNDDEDVQSRTGFTVVEADLGVDFSIMSLKLDLQLKGDVGMLLNRQFLDVCFADRVLLNQFPLSGGVLNVTGVFPFVRKIFNADLSFVSLGNEVTDGIVVCPMDIRGFVLLR